MTTLDDWKQDSEYGWSHPTGWNIARYIVNGTPVFMPRCSHVRSSVARV
ncbi:hypothetical protein LMG10661_01611 [Ralstonia syzygii subsp. syzygii]|nr:hypothetical protein LMG10661_01611 [Ralstonia syzygii subsp. syzygii]